MYLHVLCPPPPLPRRMGVDLLIDPVSLGWYRSLRVLKRVVMFISNLQARFGKKNNITSRYSSESDLEKVFFLHESRVINQSMKPEQIRKYENLDGVLCYRSQFMDKPKFNFADLDKIPFSENVKNIIFVV